MVPMLIDEGAGRGGPVREVASFGVGRVPHLVDGGDGWPKPFDFKVNTKDGVQLTRCWYRRGEMWVKRTEEPSLAIEGTTATLCARINTRTGEVTLSVTPDTELPAEDGFVNRAIYELERATTNDAWRVGCDIRWSAVQLWE